MGRKHINTDCRRSAPARAASPGIFTLFPFRFPSQEDTSPANSQSISLFPWEGGGGAEPAPVSFSYTPLRGAAALQQRGEPKQTNAEHPGSPDGGPGYSAGVICIKEINLVKGKCPMPAALMSPRDLLCSLGPIHPSSGSEPELIYFSLNPAPQRASI